MNTRRNLNDKARERCDRLGFAHSRQGLLGLVGLALPDLAPSAHDDGVFFGYAHKLLRLVLAIASRSPYNTPWSTLVGRCDTLSDGLFSKDTHLIRVRPYGWLLVAKHNPLHEPNRVSHLVKSPFGSLFFLSKCNAAGLRWLRERTGIPPRYMSLDKGVMYHFLAPHKKINRLLRWKK